MSGACIITGLGAFVLFVIYDLNSVRFQKKLIKPAFFVGFVLLIIATAMMFAAGWSEEVSGRVRQVVLLALAAVFLALLVYTLFFALPFQPTYIRENSRPKVYSEGVYALCRHPGVLWFIGMYACFALAMPTAPMIRGSVVFSVCNVLYVIMQDMWTFPKYFGDYSSYKDEVPFLIPTVKSGKRCFNTIAAGKKHV